MQKMLLFCAIATLVGCSTAKETQMKAARKTAQAFLKAYDTGKASEMYALILEKGDLQLSHMQCLIDQKSTEDPTQTVWHKATYWKVTADSVGGMPGYMVTPSVPGADLPLFITEQKLLSIYNSNICLMECDEDEMPTTPASDYSKTKKH